MFLKVPLRSACADLHIRGSLEAIRDRMLPRVPQRFCSIAHVPPRATAHLGCFSTHSHALHLQVTRLHVPSRASALLLTSFCHVSPSCVIVNVTCLRQPLTSSFDFWRFDCWHSVGLIYWLSKGWSLTFSQSWLFAVQCSLPSFSRRFHFCSPFLHILLLNEE